MTIDSNTILLISSNTFNGDTNFVDSGRGANNPHAITPVLATHSTDKAKFGASSIRFYSGRYLQIPDSTDWDFTQNDFTVDFWIDVNYNGNGYVLGHNLPGGGSTKGFGIRANGSSSGYDLAVVWVDSGGGIKYYKNTTNLYTGAFKHVAVVRSGNDMLIFTNGILESASTLTTEADVSSEPLYIGSNSGEENISAYIDEFRISDVARWTENFTPPEYAYATQEQQGIESLTVSDNISIGYGYSYDNPLEAISLTDTIDLSAGRTQNFDSEILSLSDSIGLINSTEQQKTIESSVVFPAFIFSILGKNKPKIEIPISNFSAQKRVLMNPDEFRDYLDEYRARRVAANLANEYFNEPKKMPIKVTLNVTIPNYERWLDSVIERSEKGWLFVDLLYREKQGKIVSRETIIVAMFDDMRTDLGTVNSSMSLSGSTYQYFGNKSNIQMPSASYKSLAGGKKTYRFPIPDSYLQPYNYMTTGDETILVGDVNYAYSADGQLQFTVNEEIYIPEAP